MFSWIHVLVTQCILSYASLKHNTSSGKCLLWRNACLGKSLAIWMWYHLTTSFQLLTFQPTDCLANLKRPISFCLVWRDPVAGLPLLNLASLRRLLIVSNCIKAFLLRMVEVLYLRILRFKNHHLFWEVFYVVLVLIFLSVVQSHKCSADRCVYALKTRAT